MTMMHRDALKAAEIEKSCRIVMLRANWETQDKLREWAKAAGFDLGWSYSGWPQSSWDFDFHVTVVASGNEVKVEDGVRYIDCLELTPKGFEVMGDNTPTLALEPNATLNAIREFFVATFNMQPTYPDFKPHISLSYKWNGTPELSEYAPAFPDFPLKFDLLMVARLEDKPKASKDAAAAPRKVFAAADKAEIAGTRRTADGYLVTEARVARGGNIQDYYGHEIGEGEPNQLFKVWRPEDQIFRADSLATFAHKPVTLDHPPIEVTPDSWRREAVGHVGSEVVRDGEFVRVPLVVMDAGAIKEIENGTREISMGYDCELVMEAGITPDGRAYDAYQKNIRINHCAIVPAGRAGPQCRIGDARAIAETKRGNTMKTVTIDGKAYEVADDVAAALIKGTIGSTLSDAAKALEATATIVADLKKGKEDAEKALADALAMAEEAKKAVPTADAIHKMAADLAGTITLAKALAPTLDAASKMPNEIRREAVVAKLGEGMKDKSDEYIAAMFDALSKQHNDGADPFADAVKSGAASTTDGASKARQAYLDSLHNGYKS